MNFQITELEIDNVIFSIYIGKNAKGNDEIIKMTHPDSLWFHFDKISSPHIILESKGTPIPKRYIYQVAQKLFQYKRNAPRPQTVIYTEVKNLKLTKTLGTVIPISFKSIKIK